LVVSPADFDDHVMDGFASLTRDVRERFPHNWFQAEAGAVVPKYDRAGLFASIIAPTVWSVGQVSKCSHGLANAAGASSSPRPRWASLVASAAGRWLQLGDDRPQLPNARRQGKGSGEPNPRARSLSNVQGCILAISQKTGRAEHPQSHRSPGYLVAIRSEVHASTEQETAPAG
jgi:hypothetical protein